MEPALIPGLPDDIASHCLALTPRRYHGYLQRVSKKWKAFVTSDAYFAIRRCGLCVSHQRNPESSRSVELCAHFNSEHNSRSHGAEACH